MTSAAVQALYNALCGEAPSTPAPAHFMLPMFTEPTALSAPAWPLPVALKFSGGAPRVEQFDSFDEQHALSLLASDMTFTPKKF